MSRVSISILYRVLRRAIERYGRHLNVAILHEIAREMGYRIDEDDFVSLIRKLAEADRCLYFIEHPEHLGDPRYMFVSWVCD